MPLQHTKFVRISANTAHKTLRHALLSASCAALIAGCASRSEAPPATAPTSTANAPVVTGPAPEIVINDNAPLQYVVKKGDTLWDIASYYLRDPWLWPEVWLVNDQKVTNPHLIYPGDVLTLLYVDGVPQISRNAGIERFGPRVRVLPLESAIPTIPIDAIREFLKGPRLVDRDTLRGAPYVVEFVGEHVIGGENIPVYVKGVEAGDATNYQLVREGEPYRDPDDGDVIGIEAIPVGLTEISDLGDISVAAVLDSSREVRKGDRLLPVEDEIFSANFYPHAPTAQIDGRIISVFDGVSRIGQYAIIALNRGDQHGLEPGHVLSIYQAGRKVPDPYGPNSYPTLQLPDALAGTALVFKTYDRLSYALVMDVSRPARLMDKVRNPVVN